MIFAIITSLFVAVHIGFVLAEHVQVRRTDQAIAQLAAEFGLEVVADDRVATLEFDRRRNRVRVNPAFARQAAADGNVRFLVAHELFGWTGRQPTTHVEMHYDIEDGPSPVYLYGATA